MAIFCALCPHFAGKHVAVISAGDVVLGSFSRVSSLTWGPFCQNKGQHGNKPLCVCGTAVISPVLICIKSLDGWQIPCCSVGGELSMTRTESP